MRIAISGGSGMIGSALTGSLTREGHEVQILSRQREKNTEGPGQARMLRWNGSTPGPWQEQLEGIDAVINLAGASISGGKFFPRRWTTDRKKSILDSRVKAGNILTETILRLENPPKVFLQASAIGYYGAHGEKFLYENQSAGNTFLARVCKQWEASTLGVEQRGIRRIVTRIGLVLKEDSGILPLYKLPFLFYGGGPLGSGQQYMSWIHMEDLVRAMVFLLEKESAVGVYNLTAPNPVTNSEFSRTLGKLLHRPSSFRVPAFALRALLGEAASLALEGQRVLPRRLLNEGFSFSFDTVELALADLLTR